ncbi:MAG: RNA 2',3'-cyclic phosphodiesterase, partial [Anaerolineae bacterium]|nr:RNA 2',3'-cyclic phosphodiesterase [Anaerolineae bacterium]
MATLETYRTFVALPLSSALHVWLTTVQRQLKRTCPEGAIRWVNPEGIHLTLFFIGDMLVSRLEPTQEALAAVARNAAPVAFSVGGLGAFPNLRRPRVVWAGIQDTSRGLAILHGGVNEALAHVGYTPEVRPFSPHLTLGRINRRASREEAQQAGEVVAEKRELAFGGESVEELVLFRSVLKA